MLQLNKYKFAKRIGIILIGLSLWDCNAHYFLKSADSELTVAPIVKEKKAKVAYVGFVPFRSYLSASSGRSRTYTAVLDSSKRLVFSESFAMPAYKLKSNGLRKDVSKENVSRFIGEYIGIVKKSGTEELIHVIEPVKDGGKTADGKDSYTPYLKDLGVDYYVVGALSPPFEGAGFITVFPHLFSTLFSMVTLGIFPSFQWGDAKINVKVYDKNLNKVWEREYDASYTTLRSIWVPAYPQECQERGSCGINQQGAVPGFVYKDLLPQVESDLTGFIQSK